MFEEIPNLIYICAILILLAPTVWNGLARVEYSTKILTKIFGSNVRGCYFLAGIITFFSRTRDIIFFLTVLQNKDQYYTSYYFNYLMGTLLFTIGVILVITSTKKLGFLCTHMGDHFVIFLDEKVTTFPFNILNNPMYIGGAMSMFGTSIFFNSITGVGLATFAFIIYNLYSKLYEEQFTKKIYEGRSIKEKNK